MSLLATNKNETLANIEDSLSELSSANRKIENVLSILNDSLENIHAINLNDKKGSLTKDDLNLIHEQNTVILLRAIEMLNTSDEISSEITFLIGKVK